FSKVLRRERIGVLDNFFDLGGHSLLATQVISRVRDESKVELTLRTLFEAPTVAGLAQHIQARKREAATQVISSITKAQGEGNRPLSFAQQRLWFLDYLEPNSPAYNMPAAVLLHGQLEVAVLERTINEIVRRHEVLRTTFVEVKGQPIQVVHAPAPVSFQVEELPHVSEAERQSAALMILNQEANQPFNLAIGPLFRIRLLRLSPELHTILVTMHHIVSDGWSTNIFLNEVKELYAAFRAGRPSPLKELTIQYADYAVWQRNLLQGAKLEAELGYWRKQLDGLPPMLELPTDKPRSAGAEFRGARETRLLSPELSEALGQLSRREGVTLFMTLLAAFQVLLGRYNGQQDIVIGTPVSGRTRSEVEGLIGFFVNTLVLRTDLSGDPPFSKLLKQVRQIALDAQEHQEIPFERLVEALQPERDLSITPLFQVMFAMQNIQQLDFHLPGLTLSPVNLERTAAVFDLNLDITEGKSGLFAALEYNTELFFPGTAARILAHLEILLQAIVANPDTRLSDLPLMTAPERDKVLLEWTGGGMEYQNQPLAHQAIAERAREAPEALALSYEGIAVTYDELDKRANQLARFLREHGAGTESVIGVFADKSIDAIVAILGTLKAGAAFLPLDPSYPPERLRFMVSDAKVNVLLTSGELAGKLPPHAARVITLDQHWSEISQLDASPPTVAVDPDNLAYVIYTSGSTGNPKGVMIAHRQLALFVAAAIPQFGLKAGDRFLQFASLSFDVSIEEIFPVLAAGATLVITKELPLPSELAETSEREQLTAFELPTAYWNEWVNELARQNKQIPECLSLVIIGGESPQLDQVSQWLNAATEHVRLAHVYGLTETAVTSTIYSLRGTRSPEIKGTRTLPIGRPWPNHRVYLLDKNLQPLPPGVPGEIHIAGDVLARGYLGLPEKTAAIYIPNPFSHRRGDRLYKTGDMARYLPDGDIEFLGRVDSQLKVRGFRIE
ncbi:MAG TPA: amino acid adenylation domain-containing protein, partial [Pyrinomonadaceae bacterium]|nr:amino acid adenylation domain-containing protein [Pyrinomonadaceae bacterium]